MSNLEAPTLNELQEFTLNYYEKLMAFLKQKYRIIPFRNVRYEDTPYLILRHDIDISPRNALRMALIENKLGIKSTYFVLLSSQFYNVFEGNNMRILRRISELGHEIGLHYHPVQYRVYKKNLETTLHLQAKMLEDFLGVRICSIARHGLWDRDPFATTRRYINANHPYFRSDLFVHDSNRAWVNLENLSILLNGSSKRAQLLIHAENWQDDKIQREKLLERHVKKLEKNLNETKASLIENINADPFVLEYDNVIKQGNFKFDSTKLPIAKPNHRWISLLRFNLIYSRIGWNMHNLKEKTENRLRLRRQESVLADYASLPARTVLPEHPLVSIIITSYNYGHYLADSVESALGQTYPNVEIIVIDDGSTDKTKDVAAHYPVKYVSQKHQGVSIARNMGIRLSHGDFFVCLDGDDKLVPRFLEKTLKQISEHPSIGFVVTGSKVWDEIQTLENIWMPRRIISKYSLFAGWHGALGPVLIRKRAFKSLDHGYDKNFPAHEDLDLVFRLLSNGWKPGLVSEPLHWYRIHSPSQNPSTPQSKRIAREFMDAKFWFRQPYRRIYALYGGTIGRAALIVGHPSAYFKGLKKKIQVASRVNSYSKGTRINKEKAQQLQREIFVTIDMMIEWNRNKRLREYYARRLGILESVLERLWR